MEIFNHLYESGFIVCNVKLKQNKSFNIYVTRSADTTHVQHETAYGVYVFQDKIWIISWAAIATWNKSQYEMKW